jgi:hypothetical protein
MLTSRHYRHSNNSGHKNRLSDYNVLFLCTYEYCLYKCWNVMAQPQKPDFVFRRNGRVHLNRLNLSVQSNTGSRGLRVSGSNAGYTMFRDSVKSTGYLLHSQVFPSPPLPCVTVCHHISNTVYNTHKNITYLKAVSSVSIADTTVCKLIPSRTLGRVPILVL